MIKENTLFILGAGSSYPYEYPLGKGLVSEIIDNVENDCIYLPITEANKGKYYYNENNGKERDGIIENGYEFNDFRSAVKDLTENDFNSRVKSDQPNQERHLLNVGGLLRVHFRQIVEFYNLKKALIEFNPVSIDAFLHNHPQYVEAGKIMIVYSLLKHEIKSRFHLDRRKEQNPLTGKYETVERDDWYSYLLNDIASGITEPQQITENRIKFITFNYDLSLDYYLHSKLSNIEILKNHTEATNYINSLVSQDTHHVYGELYPESPLLEYGQHCAPLNSNIGSNDGKLNTLRLSKAVKSFSSIKTIQEEREDDESTKKYGELIGWAKNIIIIGFGFDRDNLNMLSFPNTESEYLKKFNGKNIKYLDYKGRINRLYEDFKIIDNRSGINITRSVSSRIIDAYQNDFKLYLYNS